jgi:U6 snRNA-associated Sm-like protein LSm7
MGPSMHSRGGGGGGRHGGGGPQGPQPTLDKPKREAILDLAKYVNARIRVKFTGGREGVCAHHVCLYVLRHNLTSPKKK